MEKTELDKLVRQWLEEKKTRPSRVNRPLTYKLYNELLTPKMRRSEKDCTCLDRDTDLKVTKWIENEYKLDPLPISSNVKIELKGLTAEKPKTTRKRRTTKNQPMKEIRLTEKELIHNSGGDIWNYMFYDNATLPYRQYEEDEDVDLDDWYEDGLEWLSDELLDGEVFEVMVEDSQYAITSLGRHANLKKKTFKALTLQGNAIAGNLAGGAFSVSKRVKQRWNIDLDYTKLPYEVTQHIKTTNAAKHIKEWIEQNEQ